MDPEVKDDETLEETLTLPDPEEESSEESGEADDEGVSDDNEEDETDVEGSDKDEIKPGLTDESEAELLLDGKPLEDPAPAAAWVKNLRKKVRDQAKEINELRQRGPAQPQQALPPKPTMADYGDDPEQFERAFVDWQTKKSQIDGQKAAEQARLEAEQRQWQTKVAAFEQSVSSLPFKDAAAGVEAARADLSVLQQSVIINYAAKPAELMFVLHRNPTVAAELASVEDPIEFALKVKDLERRMTTAKTARKPATKPESRIVAGAGGAPGASVRTVSKQRDALLAKAQKTGNLDELRAFDRAQAALKKRA